MAIEFRCTECNRLLRTQDETAGKKAKCPECGTVVTIPMPGTGAEPGGAPIGPAPPEGADQPSPFGPIEPPSAGAGRESPFAGGAAPSPGAESPFGPGAAADAENPYASPSDYTVGGAGAAAIAEPGAFKPTPIDAGDVFGRAWTIYKDKWPICVGAAMIPGIINWVAGQVVNVTQVVLEQSGTEPPVAMAIWGFMLFATQLFAIWLGIGQGLVFLNVARGREASLGDLFRGGPYFLTILLASILFSLIYFGGLLLLIVPGIIFALMFSQFYYLILDRNVGVLESLSLSREVTYGNKLMIFLVALIQIALIFAGLMLCCIGVIATAPLASLMWAVAYLAMTGQRTADQLAGGPFPTTPGQPGQPGMP